jgi:hypothetical protein
MSCAHQTRSAVQLRATSSASFNWPWSARKRTRSPVIQASPGLSLSSAASESTSMAREEWTRSRHSGVSDTSRDSRSSSGDCSSAGNQSGHIDRRLARWISVGGRQ